MTGSVLPTVGAAVITLTAFVVLVAFCYVKTRRRSADHWEINFAELELGEQIGSGGYGEVYKATWKGTEVAVKVISSNRVSKEMERNFREEVRLILILYCSITGMADETEKPTTMYLHDVDSCYDYTKASQRRAVHGRIDQST